MQIIFIDELIRKPAAMKFLKKEYFIFAAGIFIFIQTILAAAPDSLYVDNEYFIVDSIKISGNDITEEYIILRELTFKSGDMVSTSDLRYNRERIFSLRLFTRVDLKAESSAGQNKKNIVIDLKESWYIYPIPFIRRNNDGSGRYSFGVNLSFKNFRGRNEHLRSIISLGYDPYFALLYQNPAFDFKNNLGISFGLSFLKLSNKSEYAKTIYGGDFDYKFYSTAFSLGKRIDQFNEISGSAGFDYIEGPDGTRGRITASGKPIDRVISFKLAYDYDSRDLKQFSQNGIFSSISLKHNGFGINSISYNVFEFDFREYRSIIGALSARWRFAFRHTFGGFIPYYDYSYFGYGEYVRGYSNDNHEGNNSIIASVEMSYPLIKEFDFSIKIPLIPQQLTSARIGIYLSGFADAGQVFNNRQRFRFSDFYPGYGFGLTILVLPYNALRLEYAFNKYGKGEILIGTGFSF